MSKKIPTQLSPAGHVQKNPDTAPEPGQHHTKSCEISLQVYFSTNTLLQKILTRHCPKNPDMAIGPILPKKNPDTAQLSWPLPKKILTQLWRLAELGNCGVRIHFIFRQEPDALVSDATGS